MKPLGRLPEFDERSRAYPIRTLLGDAPTLQTKIWDLEKWLDQGTEGACVGFSLAHEIAAEPEVGNVGNAYARMIYHEARKVDQWPGEDYEGTSVLAGVKVVRNLGWIEQYRWAFSVQDVLETLSNLGPVVLGTNWYSGMFDTNQDGYVTPTGDLVGGHAILILGYDHERQAVLLHNSWGQGWGVNGRAWLSVDDLLYLMGQQGEVCVPLVRVDLDPEPGKVDPDVIDVDVDVKEPEVDSGDVPVDPVPEPQGCLYALFTMFGSRKNRM